MCSGFIDFFTAKNLTFWEHELSPALEEEAPPDKKGVAILNVNTGLTGHAREGILNDGLALEQTTCQVAAH